MNTDNLVDFIKDFEWEAEDQEMVDYLLIVLRGLRAKGSNKYMYTPNLEECAGCIFNHHDLMCTAPRKCRDEKNHVCNMPNKYLPFQEVAKTLDRHNKLLLYQKERLEEENRLLRLAIDNFISSTTKIN